MTQKDYFGNLVFTLEICDLILRNRFILNPSLVEKAEQLREETKEAVSLHEMILGEN